MSELDKGKILEKKAHQFLWDQDYLVLPNLYLYATRTTGTGNIDFQYITDLDCFGFKFGKFLERNTFLIDCKHSNEKIFTQILRTQGIVSLMNINDSLILRDSVPATIQEFAEKFSIRLMANKFFEKKIIERNIGSFNQKAILKIADYQSEMNAQEKKIMKILESQLLDETYFDNLKQLRRIYNDLKKNLPNLEKDTVTTSKEYVFLKIFQNGILMLANIASQLIHLSDYHLKEFVNTKILGDIFFKKFVIKQFTEDEKETNEILKDLKPDYTNTLILLIKDIIENASLVNDYLRYNDLIIHEFVIFNNPKINKSKIEKEIKNIDILKFTEWNLHALSVLDKDKNYPVFLVKYLT
ncbi:MAG: hypothetical protein ACTSXD_01485 [Candidatus Heimdallarchaeaceae archaeon]